jgi:KDO2-lipid IV(A) lauroyltransferase
MANHRPIDRWLRRLVIYPAEALLVYGLYGLFALMPVAWASGLGGWLARSLGPWLRVSRRAHRNLRRALPELDPAGHRAIIRGMWDNLGRVLAEHPHLRRLWAEEDHPRIEVVGAEHLPRADADGGAGGRGGGCLLFSGHLANWELLPMGAERYGLGVTSIYRRPNNPLVHHLMTAARHVGRGRLVPKGRDGARVVVETLARGGTVAMLVDQKMNDGIPVPFFGRPAMTAPAVAQLALKFRCPLLPARAERLGGARYRLTIEPPLALPATGSREGDVRALMEQINRLLESWIRERPEQWLWLHNRWSD